jgi:hypothetical protein
MKRLLIFAAVLGAAKWAAVAQGPRVGYAAIRAMEKSFDQRVVTLSTDTPFDLLGNTRGVYLGGYGAVFTTEVNLLVTNNVSPFLRTIPKEYVVKVHAQKLQRVPLLKRSMQDAMVATAASLDNVPPGENIVLGVTLFYYNWENTSGLPAQIVMQAQRQKLLDVQLGRASRASLDAVIRVQEL